MPALDGPVVPAGAEAPVDEAATDGRLVGTGVAAALELGEVVEELLSADPQPANPTTSTPIATTLRNGAMSMPTS